MTTSDYRHGLPPPPPDGAPPEAWKKYAEELEAVIATGEQRAEFLQRRLNHIVTSPVWKLLKKARGLLPRARSAGILPASLAGQIVEPASQPIAGEPLVSILIPFRDGAKLLARCLKSIREKTGYKNYELILIDNGSVEKSTARLLSREKESPGATILWIDEPFNYARLNNRGAEAARGEHLLLLNNDIEALEPGWLAALLAYSQRLDVGAVGALLLYPDRRIQHAGVTVGQDDIAAHLFHRAPENEPGAQSARACSAVTGACLMTRRALFLELGGLNETDLPIAYNDIDYCLRLRERGLQVIYTPRARLLHHESATRSVANDPREAAYMCRRWAREILRAF